MTKNFPYPQPAIMVDCVVFGFEDPKLKVTLIKRGLSPHKGRWALPGGYVYLNETLEKAAQRELWEEAGIRNVFLEQLHTFGDLHRVPGKRTISVAYYALVKTLDYEIKADTDAEEVQWFETNKLPTLAFDHLGIIRIALERLKTKVRHEPIGFELLPEKFTLSEIQRLYEAILGKTLDRRNFRKKLLAMDLLVRLKEKRRNVAYRAPALFKFNEKKYEALRKKGFNFEL